MSEPQIGGLREPGERLEQAINRAERVLITIMSGLEVRGVIVGMDILGISFAAEDRQGPIIVPWTAIAFIAVQSEREQ